MLKRPIKYTDFNDEEITETFYFNINKTELINLEVEFKDGFQKMIQDIVKAEDNKAIWAKFKEIVLLAYGEKSDDGKSFIKSEDLKTRFSNHAAFDALLMELTTDENAGAKFIMGVMPKDLSEKVDSDKPKDLPKTAPTPPNS